MKLLAIAHRLLSLLFCFFLIGANERCCFLTSFLSNQQEVCQPPHCYEKHRDIQAPAQAQPPAGVP